jgi:hypothetical protein
MEIEHMAGKVLSSIFDDLQKNRASKNLQINTEKARKWYGNNVRRLATAQGLKPLNLLTDDTRRVSTPETNPVGQMYMFLYDPKGKKDLPVYDRFPLVIPIEKAKGGFLGMNLHYLGPKARAGFLAKLLELATSPKLNDRTRMRISYSVIKGFSRFPEARPTIKRYLMNHVQSQFVKVPPKDWEIAIFLPVHQFRKQSAKQVWGKSGREI